MAITAGRRERNKAQTRKHLLATAVQLMTEQGFDALTVEAIAIAADVGKGTIYNYFRTKEEIAVAFFVDLESRIQRELARRPFEGETLAERLQAFLEFQFRRKRPHYEFVRIFFTQMFARPEQMFPYLVALQPIIDVPLVALFEDLQERRLLRSDVALDVLLLSFKTMHLGLSAVWVMEGPPWRGTTASLPVQVALFCGGFQERR